MELGLQHSHSGLAYLIFLAALVNLVLALAPSKNSPAMAKIMGILHQVILWGGRGNLLVGITMWLQFYSAEPIVEMCLHWAALLLWAPVEIMAKRLVKPDLMYMLDGGKASKKLIVGTGLQLVVVAIIFGMMHA